MFVSPPFVQLKTQGSRLSVLVQIHNLSSFYALLSIPLSVYNRHFLPPLDAVSMYI